MFYGQNSQNPHYFFKKLSFIIKIVLSKIIEILEKRMANLTKYGKFS
jgi:hypothetical protein